MIRYSVLQFGLLFFIATGTYATDTPFALWDAKYSDFNGQELVYPRAQVIALRAYGVPTEINKLTWVYRTNKFNGELSFCGTGKHISSVTFLHDTGQAWGRTSAFQSHCFSCNADRKLIGDLKVAKEVFEALDERKK